MKYIATGGAGFIGSNLVDKLIIDGHKVHVLDNFIYGMKAVQDALSDVKIILDDDALTISPIGKFVKCPVKDRKVLIEIWNIDNYAKVSIMGDSELLLVL